MAARGPDKRLRKGSPRLGRKVAGNPRDDSPSRAKRLKLVDLITVDYLTPAKAAPILGISVTTAYRWMARDDVAAEIDRRNGWARDAARQVLQSASPAAAATVVELLDEAPEEVVSDGDRTFTRRGRHDPVRLAAARDILNRTGHEEVVSVKAEVTLLTEEQRAARVGEILHAAKARRAQLPG